MDFEIINKHPTMKIKINRRNPKHKDTKKEELFAFGERIGASITINERDVDKKSHNRFYASFDGCEIPEGSTLRSIRRWEHHQ